MLTKISDKGMTVIDDPNTRTTKTDSIDNQQATSIKDKINAKARNLSEQETREILTPFAFKIDQSLFGISLAVPWRRGMALLIDLLLVAILSGAPGELLAVLVAITLFKIGSEKRAAAFGRKAGLRKTALRVIAAFIVFVVLIETLPSMFSQMDAFNSKVAQNDGSTSGESKYQDNNGNERVDDSFIKGTLMLAATIAISQSDCEQYQCWQQLSTTLVAAYTEQSPSATDLEQFNISLAENITEKSTLNNQQIEQLTAHLLHLYATEQMKMQKLNQAVVNVVEPINNSDKTTKNETSNTAVYKGFAWLQGLIEDLGIGFGWAAFYFTVFTAIWHGQTPGKKLLRIRVIQLDGTALSIWDSFGRYGGYGAGIATGLLGFAQIYWDPNRQAIHDKISATIVINDTDSARIATKGNA